MEESNSLAYRILCENRTTDSTQKQLRQILEVHTFPPIAMLPSILCLVAAFTPSPLTPASSSVRATTASVSMQLKPSNRAALLGLAVTAQPLAAFASIKQDVAAQLPPVVADNAEYLGIFILFGAAVQGGFIPIPGISKTKSATPPPPAEDPAEPPVE